MDMDMEHIHGLLEGKLSSLVEEVRSDLNAPESEGDPRYLDEFLEAKQEINKLTGTDYSVIESACKKILVSHAKDLRIVGYLTFSLAAQYGVRGLCAGVEVARWVTCNSWDVIYPDKRNQQISAIEWFNSEKLISIVTSLEESDDRDAFVYLVDACEEINYNLAEKFTGMAEAGSDTPQLSAIKEWAVKGLKKCKPQEMGGCADGVSVEISEENKPQTTANAPVARQDSSSGLRLNEVSSDAQVMQYVKAVCRYMIDRGERAKASTILRALRWGGLDIPPNDSGKTRIPAPRKNALNELEEVAKRDGAQLAFEKAEQVFMEPGCHFALDLQLRIRNLAGEMNDSALEKAIESNLVALLTRLPGLQKFRFDDGTPFASGSTLSWIESITLNGGGEVLVEDELTKKIREANEALSKLGLSEALEIIDNIPIRSGSNRFRIALAKSDMLLEAGKVDFAETLLFALVEDCETIGLGTWEPNLAVQAMHRLRGILNKRKTSASDSERSEIECQIKALERDMCKADVALATSLL